VCRSSIQPVASNAGDRRSADDVAVVMRTAPGDLDCMKSRRSSEIFESLRLNRERSCEQAKCEGKKIIEAWKEQGWYITARFLLAIADLLVTVLLVIRLLKSHEQTRRELGGAHVPPTKVFRRLIGSVNKTIVKPRVAATANTYTSDFPDVKFRVAWLIYESGESNPVPASRL